MSCIFVPTTPPGATPPPRLNLGQSAKQNLAALSYPRSYRRPLTVAYNHLNR